MAPGIANRSPYYILFVIIFLLRPCDSFQPISRLATKASCSSTTHRGLALADLTDLDAFKTILVSSSTGEIDVTKLGVLVGAVGALALSSTVQPSRLVSPTQLQTILEGTFLEGATKDGTLQTPTYKASRDGWSALKFHEKVDGRGSGLVVGRTALTGKVFGAYNPAGWRSSDDYYSSTGAFLWCSKGSDVVKLSVLPGGDGAVYDYATGGPCFGSADLLIGPPRAPVMGGFAGPDMEDMSMNAGNLRQCKSSVGGAYDFKQEWPVRGAAQLVELEVYTR